MSPRNLLSDPAWQGSDLGHPLPDSPHAVSVALPRWRDVIAYEENDPACRDVEWPRRSKSHAGDVGRGDPVADRCQVGDQV